MAAQLRTLPGGSTIYGTKDATVELLSVEDLRIDDRYQRPLSDKKVKQIRQRFQEASAGLLVVSHRADGAYYVMDGQHRLSAIRELGYPVARCLVYEGLTLADEAVIFAESNTIRATPSHRVVFLARAIAGESDVEAILALLKSRNLAVAGKADTVGKRRAGIRRIFATSALESIYKQGGAATLAWVIDTAEACWPESVQRFDSSTMLGLAWFYREYTGRFSQVDFTRKMRQVSVESLLRTARTYAELEGGSGTYNVARAVLAQYNRGRRNRLEDMPRRGVKRPETPQARTLLVADTDDDDTEEESNA